MKYIIAVLLAVVAFALTKEYQRKSIIIEDKDGQQWYAKTNNKKLHAGDTVAVTFDNSYIKVCIVK